MLSICTFKIRFVTLPGLKNYSYAVLLNLRVIKVNDVDL